MAVLKNDAWIADLAQKGMINPFEPRMVRWAEHRPVISWGCSSFGYHIRLSPKEFQIVRHIPGIIIDPKNFSPVSLGSVALREDDCGHYFVLPAHSCGLGVALERLEVPDAVTVLCVGKNVYTKIGVIINLAPAEANWQGHLILGISNTSSTDCRIYANEGIAQLLFMEGDR